MRRASFMLMAMLLGAVLLATGLPNAPAISAISAGVDTVPPVTAINLSGEEGLNGWYTSPVTVKLSASDGTGGSGVNATMFELDGGDWQNYSAPILISADGSHLLSYHSVDNASNNESVKNATILIDKTPPTLKLDQKSGSVYGFSDVRITWTCSDPMSGIDYFEVYSDGALWEAYENSTREVHVSNFEDGRHNVTVKAFDKAGNLAEATIVFDVRMNQGGTDVVEIAAIAGAVAAVLAVIFLLLVKRRKKGKG